MVLNMKYGDKNKYEICVDEAGKGLCSEGSMFGMVYSAAVILNDIENIRGDLIKYSKKFTSPKKIKEAYDYIKENS